MAKQKGQTKEEFAIAPILEAVEDFEDCLAAEEAMKESDGTRVSFE